MDREVSKYMNFHCYLLLAAENFLLAEQFQITASSSASRLPARANTSRKEIFQRVEMYQTADISTNTEISIDCLYTKFCSDMNRSVTFAQLSCKRQSSEGRRGMLSFHFIRPSDFPGLVLLDVVCHGTAAKGPCFQ